MQYKLDIVEGVRKLFHIGRPGLYMLDVVVEFSSIMTNGSLEFFRQTGFYEGRAVPGSPFHVIIAPNSAESRQPKACTAWDVGNAPGMWEMASVQINSSTHVQFTSAKFQWSPFSCIMPNVDCVMARSRAAIGQCVPPNETIMIYTIGDSLTRLHFSTILDILGETSEGKHWNFYQKSNDTGYDVRYQDLNWGMKPRMALMKRAIDTLLHCQQTGRCIPVIYFNSGLHDIELYCGGTSAHKSFRIDAGLEEEYDCIESYKALLQEIVEYVDSSGLDGVKIFRTTTAGWLRFGNQYVDWFSPEKRGLQPFINHWLPVLKLNGIARPIFQTARWSIIDGFQTSFGRPDHTEKARGGAPLVHFGSDIFDLHTYQMFTVILEHLCPEVLQKCSQ